jgi:outer membrane biogenesis lipoprotein LolB
MSEVLHEVVGNARQRIHKQFVGSFAFLLMLVLSGCASLMAPPREDPAGRALLENLIYQNPDLSQFKGLLRMRLKTDQQSFSGRAAWVTALPDRLRVQLLNMLGQPLTSLAGDGEQLTLRSYTDQSFYRLRQTRTALEKLVQIPIGIRDLNQLLAGRPPLPEFETVQVSSDMPEEGILILLKSRWRNTLAQLYLDDSKRLRMMRAFAPDRTLRYQVRWLEWQDISGIQVPRRLELEAPGGKHLEIIIERFWPHAELSPGIFQISER